jgi:hypothetical protein
MNSIYNFFYNNNTNNDLDSIYPMLSFYNVKPNLQMSLNQYNANIQKKLDGVLLPEPDNIKMKDFIQNYYSNYYSIGLTINGHNKILPNIDKKIYNLKIDTVQNGFILSRDEQNQMYSFYREYYYKQIIYDLGYKGSILQLIRCVPSCLEDNPNNTPKLNKYICWACGVKHDDGKLI